MKKLSSLLTCLLAGYASYAQTFTTDVTINASVPVGHGSGYTSLWFPNATSVMPEVSSTYAGIALSSNVIRSASTGWAFADASKPAWRLFMGHGSVTDNFYIQRSGPTNYNPQTYFIIKNTGNIGIGTNNPQATLNIKGPTPGLIKLNPSADNGEASIQFSTKASETDNTSKWAIGPGVYSTGQNFAIGSTFFNSAVATFQTNGNVAIGTTDAKGYKLAVAGNIRATEIKVEALPWPDYVFKPSYKLPSLTEVKEYIEKNKHLPDMPSEQEVAKEGISLGEMNRLLLKKVEELTLYLIEKDKKEGLQEKVNKRQQQQINKLYRLLAKKK
ncbi:hypothetical protein KHS38_01375 [Mucilaginibacter sp. Bleaf8]|uniref:hypothetical protein n=1 Tax=Mucilaginibacter sp. Bleaf8 TaxID=2834430 RepID=UPI001BCD2A19|nr:hypothetical protein [Mucilaginibacter sp. Bleaf8]MBS7563041.1 hypothetical protein [Mucilaginibacter sp. Bleaf8]